MILSVWLNQLLRAVARRFSHLWIPFVRGMWDRHYINRPAELCPRNYEDNITAGKEPLLTERGMIGTTQAKKSPTKRRGS